MTRIVVVDDHPIFRHGLVQCIEASPELELVDAVPSVEDLALTKVADVVVLDLGLPGVSGADAVRQVRENFPVVLVVSADAGQRQVVDAIGAGAAGYLTKSAEPSEITEAIKIVALGGTYVSPTLASFLIKAAREPASFTLTHREREILALVAGGARDTEIADELFISVQTVRSHLDRIRDKTGRRRRPDLTRLALEEGMAPGDIGGS